MRIQYCSDLHLEFDQNSRYLIQNPMVVKSSILILAGDIVPLHDEFFNNPFFSFLSNNYNHVYWVPGNHEFYYKNVDDFSKSYHIKLNDKVSLVNNTEIIHESVRLVFCTLWSKINAANEKNIEQGVADFDLISKGNRKLKATDFNQLHEEGYQFLNEQLSTKTKYKTIVVTHHLPSRLCNLPVHNDSPINEAFCVDLTEKIKTWHAGFWIYGHNHFNQKPIFVGKTILITNQLGYVSNNEHGTFRRNAYISV